MANPIVATLPSEMQSLLLKVVKPKFDAYFAFTSSSEMARAIGIRDSEGRPGFLYPDQTMIPDLVFLWSLFSDVYQILGGPAFAHLVRTHPDLLSDIRVIVEGDSPAKDCSFWKFPDGQVSVDDSTGQDLSDVLKTLRNGFAHSHWLHADLSAADYWTMLGWDVANADPRFNLHGRQRNNYTIYVADAAAKAWAPRSFWNQNNLRILVTHSSHLRYYLHLLLNFLLNGSRENIFNRPHIHAVR